MLNRVAEEAEIAAGSYAERDVERQRSSQGHLRDAPRNLDFADLCEESMRNAQRARVVLLRSTSGAYQGTTADVAGLEMLNFGSCSYLGLEIRPELREGVISAVRRYGTQFPFAKPQLECALYHELETSLEAMTEGKAVVASSTTLMHLAALPALIGPRDALVLDRFAHASMVTAATLLKNVHQETVPHNDVEILASRVEVLSKTHDRVWYALDGIYSMAGDFAPMAAIRELMAQFPKLYLYSDDAHSTSWLGEHGRGYTLQEIGARDRVVVTLSLNKAFSAAGGALIVPDEAMKQRVRLAGAALMFSGPIQPPMLGAAVASANIHLHPSFPTLQCELRDRIDLVHELAGVHGVGLATRDRTPITFVPCGFEPAMFGLFHALQRHGYYVAPSLFPAVGRNRSGLRLTVSLHNGIAETERLMEILGHEIRKIPAIVEFQKEFADRSVS